MVIRSRARRMVVVRVSAKLITLSRVIRGLLIGSQ